MVDYKRLLKTYIEHIKGCESIDFLEGFYTSSIDGFDLKVLRAISACQDDELYSVDSGDDDISLLKFEEDKKYMLVCSKSINLSDVCDSIHNLNLFNVGIVRYEDE